MGSTEHYWHNAATSDQLRGAPGAKWSEPIDGLLAAWVADMDIAIAPPIQEVVRSHAELGGLNYLARSERPLVADAFAARMSSMFGWQLDPADVVLLDDVVQGIYATIVTLTNPGAGVIVTSPIYHPFLFAINDTERHLINHELLRDDDWALDVERLTATVDAAAAAGQQPEMILLCNPHNPLGRVFDDGELRALADLAVSRNLIVVADEIHADLVFDGEHVPFASLSRAAAERCVTLTSATKAFNIAGVRCAVAHFGSADLRARFDVIPPHVRGGVSNVGVRATLAAWQDCDDWLAATMVHLRANRDHLVSRLRAELPAIAIHAPMATYLAWLDCRALGLGDDPSAVFLDELAIQLSPGPQFGAGGAGHARLNFATGRPVLDEILDRLVAAYG